MKQLLLLWTMLSLTLHGFSQIPIHLLLPMGVSGNIYGDTLLNNSAILQRAGIRKITSRQTAPEITKTLSPVTKYLTAAGMIESTVAYIPHAQNTDSVFFITDTFLYDAKGRLLEFRSKDARGNIYQQYKVDYSSDRKVKYTWTSIVPQQSISNTSINYYYYNEKNQLVRIEQDAGGPARVNAALYYGDDNLLDSIRHDNPAWGTYIFKKRKKGTTKEVETETNAAKFKWTYNELGQCIASQWINKYRFNSLPQSKPKRRVDVEARYYYNSDGTLSKVVEKGNGKEITTIFYTYTK